MLFKNKIIFDNNLFYNNYENYIDMYYKFHGNKNNYYKKIFTFINNYNTMFYILYKPSLFIKKKKN